MKFVHNRTGGTITLAHTEQNPDTGEDVFKETTKEVFNLYGISIFGRFIGFFSFCHVGAHAAKTIESNDPPSDTSERPTCLDRPAPRYLVDRSEHPHVETTHPIAVDFLGAQIFDGE